MDRIDNRPIPQMPWPLVQPLPSLVPTPTMNPPASSSGMGTSIAKGAQSVDKKSNGIMILLCDQWRIQPQDLKLLVENWHDDPSRITCSATEDRCGPPVIFPACCLQELRVLTGDHGARTVIERHRDLVSQVMLKNAASDLDTPLQLQQLTED